MYEFPKFYRILISNTRARVEFIYYILFAHDMSILRFSLPIPCWERSNFCEWVISQFRENWFNPSSPSAEREGETESEKSAESL